MKYIPPLNALPGDEEDDNRPHWNAVPSGNNSALRSGAFPSAIGFEACQREIVNAIVAAGIVPDADDYTQLTEAIIALIADNMPEIPEFEQYAIGEPFAVFDHLGGAVIPDNSGTQKFIKLTAGLTGVGQFNAGLLTGETLSGSFPNNTATAQIIGGPMNGQIVPLINTEKSFLRPSTVSGEFEQDAFKSHSHTIGSRDGTNAGTSSLGTNGNAPTLSLMTNATGGNETRPKNRGATFYMRII